MKIGLDYWRVCSHYPDFFRALAGGHLRIGNEVHIISAIGKKRSGTIRGEVEGLRIPFTAVHEVIFEKASGSPELKLAKCQELGIDIFYDDREDVCTLLKDHGIQAFRVTRDPGFSDIEAERD